MTKDRFLTLYPALAGIVTDIIYPDIEDYSYNKQSIIGLLREAITLDHSIDDEVDRAKIPETFEWLGNLMITISVTDKEWTIIKEEIIQKDKFLGNLFFKNKLRRKHFGLMNLWFTLYPSLFSGDLEHEKEWDALYKETVPDPELAAMLRKKGEDFVGTPSLYDTYNGEERLLLVSKMTILLKTILINYIQKYLEM